MLEDEPSGVLRVERSDVRGSFVVVHVYSKGSNLLDLELVASEGQSAWGGTIKGSQVRKLKASGNQAPDAVWEEALRNKLLLQKPVKENAEELEELEFVSTINKDGHMSLILRRNIGELTQRLGTIDLAPTDDDKFDLWAGCAAGAKLTAEARQHAIDLEDKLAEQRENNRKLEEQLQELIRAKEEHEDALLHKFAELLNAKKLKIRDQQRLLATAKVDAEKGTYLILTRSAVANKVGTVENIQGKKSRIPESSRPSKRKTTSARAVVSDESSDGFESVQDEDELMKDATTPEPLEDDRTTDDDEDATVPTPPPEPKKGIQRGLAGKTKALEPTTSQSGSQTARSTQGSQKAQEASEEDLEPPPRRELPFAKRKAAEEAEQKLSQDAVPSQANSAASLLPAAVSSIGNDDDTTDDEL